MAQPQESTEPQKDQDQWGRGGPGSLGAEGLEQGVEHETGTERVGAGQGLRTEQDHGSEDEGPIISELNHPTSADDDAGGAGETRAIRDAVAAETAEKEHRAGQHQI